MFWKLRVEMGMKGEKEERKKEKIIRTFLQRK